MVFEIRSSSWLYGICIDYYGSGSTAFSGWRIGLRKTGRGCGAFQSLPGTDAVVKLETNKFMQDSSYMVHLGNVLSCLKYYSVWFSVRRVLSHFSGLHVLVHGDPSFEADAT